MGRKILIAVIALAVLAGGAWALYSWGYTAAQSEMAEAREEAVRRAVVQDRRARSVGESQAREREREQLEELRSELASLRAKDQRAQQFQASKEAATECLAPEALETYRSY